MTLQRSSRGASSLPVSGHGQDGHATVPPIVHDVLRSPGQPLDPGVRTLFEPRFGHDFSKVRIHADGQAAESAQAVNADAYTVGHHVVFGAGRHEPTTLPGRELLAHELTHVVQQQGSSESSPLRFGSAHDPCEREAARLASATVGGASLNAVQQASGLVQRQEQAPPTVPPPAAEPAPATGPGPEQQAGPANEPPAAPGAPPAAGGTSTSPTSPTCTLPKSLGVGRTACGTGTDFTHYDFPSISTASTAKLAAWAAANPANPLHLPIRSMVPDVACEAEMDAVLVGFAASAGHAAFSRFKAGTGGTETHNAASTLGAAALASGSFKTTLATVKGNIESQLATQAGSGALNACALSVVPPATHFGVSDGMTLKAVIGGTHGESLNATSFTGDIPKRTYSIGLEFLICDNFGVDEADLYAPGLFGFWVLQHERSATLYAPFINQLDLPVTVSGTF